MVTGAEGQARATSNSGTRAAGARDVREHDGRKSGPRGSQRAESYPAIGLG